MFLFLYEINKYIWIKGKVKEHRGNLEIHLESPDNIALDPDGEKLLTEIKKPVDPAKTDKSNSESPTLIKDISLKLENKKVTIKAKVTRYRESWKETAPNIVTVSDSTGQIEVVFWNDVKQSLQKDQVPKVNQHYIFKGVVEEVANFSGFC